MSSTQNQNQNQNQNPNPNKWQRPSINQNQGQTGQGSGGSFASHPPAGSTGPVHNPVFDEVERAAAEQSRFIKIESGQSVVLYFDPDKIRIVDREINDRKSKAVQYDVIDVNTGAEKTLTLSLSWARQLNEFLKNGYNVVRVTRRGSGFDTQYTFMPAQ